MTDDTSPEGTDTENTAAEAAGELPGGPRRSRLSRHDRVTIIGVVVIVVVALGAIGLRLWLRPTEDAAPFDPPSATITISNGETSREIKPYATCDVDGRCVPEDLADAGDPELLEVPADGTLRIDIPEGMRKAAIDVIVVRKDANPHAANSSLSFPAGESTETIEVPGNDDEKGGRLRGVEIQSMMLGEKDGAETAYRITWSVRTLKENT